MHFNYLNSILLLIDNPFYVLSWWRRCRRPIIFNHGTLLFPTFCPITCCTNQTSPNGPKRWLNEVWMTPDQISSVPMFMCCIQYICSLYFACVHTISFCSLPEWPLIRFHLVNLESSRFGSHWMAHACVSQGHSDLGLLQLALYELGVFQIIVNLFENLILHRKS